MHVEIGANNDRRYTCDGRDTQHVQEHMGRRPWYMVVYRWEQDQGCGWDDGCSGNRVRNTSQDYSDGVGRGPVSPYYQERGGTDRRRYSNEDRRGHYRHNPSDDSFYNEPHRHERDSGADRHYRRDSVNYDEYEHRDHGGGNNSRGYCDWQDGTGHEYGKVHRNDEGEIYYRTHNQVTDVQVDVFTEGMRTPAANTSFGEKHTSGGQRIVDRARRSPEYVPSSSNGGHIEGGGAQSRVERGCRSPEFVPPPSTGNQPDQANENDTVRRRDISSQDDTARHIDDPTENDEMQDSYEPLTSTPIIIPGPDGPIVAKPGSNVLSRNQHFTPLRNSHISSDVMKGQGNATPANCNIQNIAKLPTGNVPWMLNASKRPNGSNQCSANEDGTKRARTDSNPEQVNAAPEMQNGS